MNRNPNPPVEPVVDEPEAENVLEETLTPLQAYQRVMLNALQHRPMYQGGVSPQKKAFNRRLNERQKQSRQANRRGRR